MRESLTVIIALLILAVVLDGLRRMRQARRGKIRMAKGKRRTVVAGDGDEYGSELPNGGARVVNVRKSDDAQQLYRKIREEREQKKRRLGRPNRIPQQVALNLDEHVPTLMEMEQDEQREQARNNPRMEKPSALKRKKTAAVQEELLDEDPLFDDGDRIEPQLSMEPQQALEDEISDEAYFGSPVESAPTAFAERDAQADNFAPDETELGSPQSEYESDDYPDDEDLDEGESGFGENGEGEEDQEESLREPEDVLVINVMAPKGQRFRGDVLLETVLERGMRFGSMNIFHHHDSLNGGGGVLYSMANIVVPGTFDLASMKDDFTTPGVSLFLALPVEADSSEAFENMLKTAKSIASRLGGELKDENRSVLTAQTIEHYRSRIKEFERKRLSRHD
ncbi:cell division protein ZipA [Proteobacteria bacterium 005FR1]|nr:cell division protein ZipA [Proteobacteria bacterium 005FR1]